MAVETHTNLPDRFRPGLRLSALNEDGTRKDLEVREVWPHKGLTVLSFAEITSITEAETLLRCELQIPREQRAALEAGWNYVSDLVGCMVFDRNVEVGCVESVTFGAGEAPLLLVSEGSKQFEIPYAEAYLNKLDLESKRIEMELPEGLLEVNAPLTGEEKQQQNISRIPNKRKS